MKVFTKELDKCQDCPFFNDDGYMCNYSYHPLLDENKISESCPFNKSLTKKDIESFEFNIVNTYKNDKKEIFSLY